MTTLVPGKTPRKAVAGGRFHTIATSTQSMISLKTTAARQAPDNNHGLSSRGGDLFDLAAADFDDPAGDSQLILSESGSLVTVNFGSGAFFEGTEIQPDTSSNIKVYVRVRPANDSELSGESENIVSVHSTDTVRRR